MIKSLKGRQKRCQTSPVLASQKGLPIFIRVVPSVKTLGYFQKAQQTPVNTCASRGFRITASSARAASGPPLGGHPEPLAVGPLS